MKKLLLIFLLFPFVSFSQSDCDSTACTKYADLNSFEILTNYGTTEADNSGNEVILTCEMLCEIEAKRKQYEDFIFEFDGIRIKVFSAGYGNILGTEGGVK